MVELKSRDVKIVIGDFNVKVGDKRVEDTVGTWGLGIGNESGSRLIDWCREIVLSFQTYGTKTILEEDTYESAQEIKSKVK